jgi:cytochrome b
MARVPVWDLPLRLFHWALFICVTGAFISVNIGGNAMVWHGRFGLTMVGLLVFRLVWGFAGSTYARFSSFVRGPSVIRAYLRGEWHGLGHNPLGALSVLAMLGTLTAQALTGLFSNDDIAFQGYLASLVSSDMSSRLTGIHTLFEPVLIVLILAHLGAIVFYTRVKKDNLVKPMIVGWKETPTGETARGGGLIACVLAISIALAAVYGASGGWMPEPVPEAPQATPAW